MFVCPVGAWPLGGRPSVLPPSGRAANLRNLPWERDFSVLIAGFALACPDGDSSGSTRGPATPGRVHDHLSTFDKGDTAFEHRLRLVPRMCRYLASLYGAP